MTKVTRMHGDLFNELFNSLEMAFSIADQRFSQQQYKQKLENLIEVKNQNLKDRYTRGIYGLVKVMEYRDKYMEGHSRRVSQLSFDIARKLKLSELDCVRIKIAGLLHDVGKACLPDRILNKKTQLTEAEWRFMKDHPEISARLASYYTDDEAIIHIIKHHHERWDGYGYPSGLKGPAIPKGSRIINVVDGEGRFIEVNPEACKMRGYTKKEMLDAKISDIIHPESVHIAKAHFEQVQETGKAEGTLKGKRKDGSTFWYDNLAVKINEDLYISFQSDVTEQVENKRKLKESEHKFRALFEQNVVAMYLHNFEGNIIDVNQEACVQLGYKRKELLEMTIFDFIYPKIYGGCFSKEELITLWDRISQGERTTVEDIHQRKDGTLLFVEVSTGMVRYNKQDIIMALVKDITNRKKAEEKIRYMSYHDSLTGLYNRNYFEAEMKKLDTIRQFPVSILIADLNGLKLVNDSYGRQIGDEMLKTAAKIINDSCRKEDIVARWGDDEFAIMLTRTDAEELKIIYKRIKYNCQDVYVKDIPISLALGSGVKDSVNKDLEEVLREAEDNMFRQKLAENQSARSSILQALLSTLQAKSYETEAHAQRMLDIAWEMGRKLDLPDEELNRLYLLITLHDIGKINIPEEILTKSGKLNEEEWEMIKEHPEIGYRIAKATNQFSHVAEDILSHHERWDGGGYPRGLKQSEIPLLARITAIVDAYDVMSNGRPYKSPKGKQAIIDEFKKYAGIQFDPSLVDIFIDILASKD